MEPGGICMGDGLKRLIQAAQQLEEADLIIQNGTVVDVFSLETFEADVAIRDGRIVGIGTYPNGKQVVDATGKFILPGFIDGHIHIESTMVTPSQFSRALIKHGITTVVTDPHEIANVAGTIGIDFMLEDAANADMDILMKLPSCVPATPFEQNGATLTADDLRPYLTHPTGLTDTALNVYSTAGIRNDHEAVTAEEAMARVRRGIHVLVREGSAAKDLLALLPAINEKNSRRFSFCTDDKHLDELAEEGTINYAAQLAIQQGLDPLIAIQMATLNNAVCHGIQDKGAIAPGYVADILITDSLERLSPETIIKDGRVLNLDELRNVHAVVPQAVRSSLHLKKVTKVDLQIPLLEGQKAWVIGIVTGSIITQKNARDVQTEDGFFVADPQNDQLKIVVCERHHQTGSIGAGIVSGLGLKRGAIASTVAHDSHNLVVAGTNDEDMLLAIEEAERMQGGLVIVDGGKVLASVPLRVGGIMSEKPYEEVIKELHQLHGQLATLAEEGQNIFMILSFLCLPVIPRLKLTDKGLFDVDSFQHIEVGIPM